MPLALVVAAKSIRDAVRNKYEVSQISNLEKKKAYYSKPKWGFAIASNLKE